MKTLSKELSNIEKDVYVAINRRKEIGQRINASCEKLKNNPDSPDNRKERRRLSWYLNVERRFLDEVRQGIKNGISILEATLRELKNIKVLDPQVRKEKEAILNRLGATKDPKVEAAKAAILNELESKLDPAVKAEMLQTIQFLIDAMSFAKGKVKVIERKIKYGERLEIEDNFGENLNKLFDSIREEKEIDRELALVLEGKLKKVRGNLNVLKYMVKDKYTAALGLYSAGIGAGIIYGGSSYYTNMGVSPGDNLPAVVTTITGVALTIMLIVAGQTHLYEESRRKGVGEVGGMLKIPK